MTTLGTRLFTTLHGEHVGDDAFSNAYYQDRRLPSPGGRRRRWVIYKGAAEASTVPPEWHAWLHHMTDRSPSEAPPPSPSWRRPQRPNPTGTRDAYRPPGDLLGGVHPEGMPPAYEPWRPNS